MRSQKDCEIAFFNRQGRQERQGNIIKGHLFREFFLGALGVLGGFFVFK